VIRHDAEASSSSSGEDLEKVEGISKALAETIYEHLH